jgi:hypothetical protein
VTAFLRMASIWTNRSSYEGIWPMINTSRALRETDVDDLRNQLS